MYGSNHSLFCEVILLTLRHIVLFWDISRFGICFGTADVWLILLGYKQIRTTTCQCPFFICFRVFSFSRHIQMCGQKTFKIHFHYFVKTLYFFTSLHFNTSVSWTYHGFKCWAEILNLCLLCFWWTQLGKKNPIYFGNFFFFKYLFKYLS